MCTGIYTVTKDGKHLLSRTMDFSMPLEPAPLFLPRQFNWTSAIEKRPIENAFGFVGAGRLLDTSYFVADGVNEHGLSVAELYLPGEVYYGEEAVEGKKNFAPHELILWLLGNFESVAQIEEALPDVRLIADKVPMLGIITPLHWIITDATGRCVVIEPTEEVLTLTENPVGVMTNSPRLDWHIQNLRNYLHTRPAQYAPTKFGDFLAEPFSQGTGTTGLPGGFSPPDRFVRAAFFKQWIEPASNEELGVNNNYHILATVRIPKGIVITDTGASDYSQYVGTMCNESKSYYYSSYDDFEIVKITLDEMLLSRKEPKLFNRDNFEHFKKLN